MRRILLAALLVIAGLALGIVPRAAYATSIVQQNHGGITFGGTSGTAAFSSNVTSGNYIVVGAGFRETTNQTFGAYTISVSDTLGTSFAAASNANQAFFDGQNRNHVSFFYVGKAPSSGADTVTVSITGGLTAGNSKGGAIFIYEISGITGAVESVKTCAISSATGTGGCTTGSAPWSSSDPFVVSFINFNAAGSETYTPSNGGFSSQKDESQNDSFASLYGTGSGLGGSPTTFAFTNSPTDAGGITQLGVVFSTGSVLSSKIQGYAVIDPCSLCASKLQSYAVLTPGPVTGVVALPMIGVGN